MGKRSREIYGGTAGMAQEKEVNLLTFDRPNGKPLSVSMLFQFIHRCYGGCCCCCRTMCPSPTERTTGERVHRNLHFIRIQFNFMESTQLLGHTLYFEMEIDQF